MKGVVLAGGLGSRLWPLTRITNKHLLPVYDRPMIHYPLGTLVAAGVRDVLVVTGGPHAEDVVRLLGDGRALGLESLSYAYQQKEGGVADALARSRGFAAGGRVVVILADNIFQDGIAPYLDAFRHQASGARLLLKRVRDPERFGVPLLEGRRLARIEEKPERPGSPYAVTGAYMYDADVFDIIAGLTPSARGELEITDVNNAYIERGDLEHDVLPGWWTDAGTFDSLQRASRLARLRALRGTPGFSRRRADDGGALRLAAGRKPARPPAIEA